MNRTVYVYRFYLISVLDQYLHDGTNYFAQGVADVTSSIQQKPAITPSGWKYDPYGWNDAPIIPGTITQRVRCVSTVSLTAKAAYDAFFDVLGKAAYVYAYEAGYSPTGYYTARARLTQVGYSQPDEIVGDAIWAKLKFELYEDWTFTSA